MKLETGQLWKDHTGHARICGVVPVEGKDYAVMLRTRGAGGRKRRPFLFPVDSLRAGDDGWEFVCERELSIADEASAPISRRH